MKIEEEALFVSQNSNRFFENADAEDENQEENENEDDDEKDQEDFFPKYFNGGLKQNLPTMFVSASGRTWFVEKKNLKKSVQKFAQESHQDESEEKNDANQNIILLFNQRDFRKKYENDLDHPTGWNFEKSAFSRFFQSTSSETLHWIYFSERKDDCS